MKELFAFLVSVFLISFSGAMAPGPVTAAAITHGAKSKYAGISLALGHAVIELPLIIIVVLGFNRLLASHHILNTIGLLGGAFLLYMGIGLFRDIKKPGYSAGSSYSADPILTGIVLSATNPYFLLWWITIGIKLASQARAFGIFAFLLFILVHWLCDLGWLEFLSYATLKGTKVMSERFLKIMLGICGTALFAFGVKFIYDSLSSWFGGFSLYGACPPLL